jgi:hypothetical protein
VDFRDFSRDAEIAKQIFELSAISRQRSAKSDYDDEVESWGFTDS